LVDPATLQERFRQRFGQEPRIFAAPGRVNLIGEHTDYNDGLVLPLAIDRRTFVAAATRPDRVVKVRSPDVDELVEFSLDADDFVKVGRLAAYVGGVARELEALGLTLSGLNLAIASDVPIGSGLSSSAALEIAVGRTFLSMSGQDVGSRELARAAQAAEHKYAGTRCGIMDQLTASMGQRDHALLIDCRSLEITPIKLNFPDTEVVICNTNVKHDLAHSAYNERREECRHAVELLCRRRPDIRALRDVSLNDFDSWEHELPSPIRERCRHVVTEIDRTRQAAEALRRSDPAAMGRLIARSHASLRDDYEVSCRELNLMVDLAASVPGTYGARMMGGGFGGCTVNLVRRQELERFKESIAEGYLASTGIDAAIYVVKADDGASEVSPGNE